jgi:hypothetical protein
MFTMQNAKDERWTDQDKFWQGHTNGWHLRKFKEFENVDGQAYDRGYEVGMNELRASKGGPKQPKLIHWGDIPGIEELVGCN